MATKKKSPPKKSSASKTSRPVKPAARKPAKPAARKPAPKKTPAKKTPAKKKPSVKSKAPVQAKPPVKKSAKAPARKPAPKKAAPKTPARKPAPQKPSAKKPLPVSAPKAPAPKPPKAPRAFRKEELATFRAMLQQQLELVQGNLNALAGDNLKLSPMESTGDISSHSTHMADHGTDNFDRELALSLASSRQDSLYDIEDAIRRIDDGEYGVCEACGQSIERPRLRALPFAKKCLVCQNAAERGRGRFQPFRADHRLPAVAADDTPEPSDS